MNEAELALQTADVVRRFLDKEVKAIREYIADSLKALPAPKDGADGKDAEVDYSRIESYVKQAVADAVASIEIPAAPIGEKGERGGDGRDGRDGRDGKDGLDIDILDDIIPEKSYPYGTYARHKGGLWKAVNDTRGMLGWQCIVNGVAKVKEVYDGERTIERKTIMSNGDETSVTIKLAHMIDRGVFREDKHYDSGDGVSYGGSFWICQKDTPSGVPGSTDDWRLAVKRGRDGRESVKIGGKDGK